MPEKKKKKKFFYYSTTGGLEMKFNSMSTIAAAEFKLPSPDPKYAEKCAYRAPRIGDLRVGTNVKIAIGDPIIVDCKITKTIKTKVPKKLLTASVECAYRIRTFQCKKGKLWVHDSYVCLAKDL